MDINDVTIAVPEGYIDVIDSLPYADTYRVNCVTVSKTKGPAHTARIALDNSTHIASTLILDSDVLNYTNDLWFLGTLQYSGVLVHSSTSSAYSYVNKLGLFTKIIEKTPISEWAVRGAYFIHEKHMNEYIRIHDKLMPQYNELYISYIMYMMLNCEKYALECTYAPVDWGTPEAIEASGARICT
jgi:hypothetical protein